ncbi:hypothetical protein DY000_02014864 [Brassica cretica]|uniref:EGF-like domain-containing protein n=1 Tax=Brassica cretica TaxID=69181 RepID=A0ABQ7D0D3_BRACR|nr:hypothetical protein DY000_02014864 [Brassica cretica]
MPEGSKSRKSTEKLEVSQCMSSGRGVNHLISCLSSEAQGVCTHGSSTCGLTCISTRCHRICNRSMLIDMWAVWCCCTTDISDELNNNLVEVGSTRLSNQTSSVHHFDPCVYSFLVEEGKFNFSSPEDLKNLRNGKRFPVVLDWSIGNKTCEEVGNKSICGGNSTCFTSNNRTGCICTCNDGYDGNQYLSNEHRCQADFNECTSGKHNCPYRATCSNKVGGFDCKCKSGHRLDTTTMSCKRKTKDFRWAMILIAHSYCDNPPFGIRMVETEDWSNINLVVESRAIKIDWEISKNEVVEELIHDISEAQHFFSTNSSEREQKNIRDFIAGRKLPERPKSGEWTEKFEVACCMDSERVMQPDIWEEWWRPACVLDMQPTMWSMRCRRACVRSHAERLTGCHQPEVTTPVLGRRLQRFLFELRVVQGRPFRVRHAFEVSWDRRLLEEFKKGFWSRFRARGQSHNEPNTFAARKVARVCPYAAGQRGCIKHALYGEVARKLAPPCDTLSRLHVSYVGCSNPCAFVAAS